MKTKTADVDVIIPVYNGAAFVGDAIDSVLGQTLAPNAIIVVDDGSTDDTQAVISRYGGRVQIIRHDQNLGLPAARNTGIRNSRSKLIAFLDGDDVWVEKKLERQVREFEIRPEIGLCYTDLYDCAFDLKPLNSGRKFRRRIAEHVFEELYLTGFPIPPSTVMVRREVFEECGLFNESMLKAQDYECWLRIAMKYPISCIDEPLCYRRDNPKSITSTKNPEKSYHYTMRAFELCGEWASSWGIKLPMPVEDRKRLYLYRACKESILWGRAEDKTFFFKKLLESGGLKPKQRIALKLLKYYTNLKTKFIAQLKI